MLPQCLMLFSYTTGRDLVVERSAHPQVIIFSASKHLANPALLRIDE